MTKKLLIATIAVLSFVAGPALAQVAAPQVTASVAARTATQVNFASTMIFQAIGATAAAARGIDAAVVNKLATAVDGDSRATRTTRKLALNLQALQKLSQNGKIGTAEVSALKVLNAELLKQIAEIDKSEMTDLLEIINGELGRAIDATEGNASELETAKIISNLTKIAENSKESISPQVQQVLNVTVQQLKEACPVKQAS